MSKDKKISFWEVRKLVIELNTRDRRIKKLVGMNRKYESEALKIADKARKEQILRELKNMSVDELSSYKLGIRVSAFRDAGYTCIADLKDKNAKQLEIIEGIGPKSAENTVYAVGDICKNVEENVRVRVDVDNPTKKEKELVKVLYQAQNAKRLSSDVQDFYKETHDTLKSKIRVTAPARNWLTWQFIQSDKKEFILESLSGLEEYAEDYIRKTDEFLRDEYAIKKAEHANYWQSFVTNSAGFYATLERARRKANRKTNKLDDAQYIAIKNGLPEELAIAISEVPLDLKGLSANLYPYQEYGVQYILNQGAVLLGDDMGLGKTLQAIASMVALRNSGATHFMVVCPASVIINWCREIDRFSDLKQIKLHGSKTEESAKQWIENGGVAVTTYETLAKIEIPDEFRYDMLVVDEAHYVKNPKATRTIQLLFFRQHTDRVLFMSGTPLENRVAEMCFLIGCLQPDVAKSVVGITSISMAPDFRKKVSGVYFRRTKEDVLDDLPDKVEKEEWIELLPSEKKRYKEFVEEENFMKLRQASWIFGEGEESSKLVRLKELIDEYLMMGRKIIVFSFFTNTIETIKKSFPDETYGPITGAIAPAKRQEIIDQFSDLIVGGVLLAQIQAGGTGLNIQAASVVIFCEPQLKPSIEEQAIARAYRMGQNNTVMVHRLLNVNTVDEQIVALLKEKQEVFDEFADKSDSGEESLISTGVKNTEDDDI